MAIDAGEYVVEERTDFRAQLSPAVTAVAGIDVQYLKYDVGWTLPALDFDSSQSTGPIFGRPLNTVHGTGNVVRPAGYAMFELDPKTVRRDAPANAPVEKTLELSTSELVSEREPNAPENEPKKP